MRRCGGRGISEGVPVDGAVQTAPVVPAAPVAGVPPVAPVTAVTAAAPVTAVPSAAAFPAPRVTRRCGVRFRPGWIGLNGVGSTAPAPGLPPTARARNTTARGRAVARG